MYVYQQLFQLYYHDIDVLYKIILRWNGTDLEAVVRRCYSK